MKTGYQWAGIQWKKMQDVIVQRRVVFLGEDGKPVLRRGKVIHPTRERVRQKRMGVYLAALAKALRLPEKEGEQDVRATLTWALKQEGAKQMKILKGIGEMEIGLDSPLRQALASANQIYRPVGWHGREGTTKEIIKGLVTENMTVREIAKAAGCGVSYVSQALKDLEKTCKSSPRGVEKYAWDRFFPYDADGRVMKGATGRWQEYTDKSIARALRISNPMVVTQYRNRNKFMRRMVAESVAA
jgi:DNA-binding CsgD family transcriptional regulator